MSNEQGVTSDIGRYGIIPEWVLLTAESPRAIHLYAVLACFHADRDTGESYPSRRTLAAEMGVSMPTVDTAVGELKRIGALEVTPRKAKAGDSTSSGYLLHYALPQVIKNSAPPPQESLTPLGEVNQNQEPESVEPSLPSVESEQIHTPDWLSELQVTTGWKEHATRDQESKLVDWAAKGQDEGHLLTTALAFSGKARWGAKSSGFTYVNLPQAFKHWVTRPALNGASHGVARSDPQAHAVRRPGGGWGDDD